MRTNKWVLIGWLLALAGLAPVWANSAQPGFWDAGGTGTFSLLYPEDSAAYKKAQMVRELVAIQLYPGYAVVKGTYWMHNTTADTLVFKAGYPLYGHYVAETEHYSLMDISFDSLYSMKVKLDKEEVLINEVDKIPTTDWGNDLWHTFPVRFNPLDTVLIEVYFILNTNNTTIRQGYNTDHANGFIYLLETGATWKQPIMQGEIRIQMMDGLKVDDIVGIAPDSVMQIDKATQTIVYRFNDLYPTHASNIVVAYSDAVEDFDFGKTVANSQQLYGSIEVLANQQSSAALEPIAFDDPFEVHGTNWVMTLFMIGIIVVPILGVLALIVALVFGINFAINRFYAPKKMRS